MACVAEDGRQDRTRVVCRNGREINEPDSQMCTRDTDGVIVNHGNWGACNDFADICDESGNQARQVSRCEDGQVRVVNESQACMRDTDGMIVDDGAWSVCGPDPEDPCDYRGVQRRELTECQNGEATDAVRTRECMYSSDGDVLEVGDWGACGSFATLCAEDGRQERTKIVCQDEGDDEVIESRACRRDSDGVEVFGDWGPCEGFESACDESGTQTRTHTTCRDGAEVIELDERACTRDTDGVETSVGRWGECGGFDGACDESGTRTRERMVCQNGNAVSVAQSQACTRDTDGTEVSAEQWSICGGYTDACDESGTQNRGRVVCSNGNQVNVEDERDCSRDTDGVEISIGQWGACGGFADGCDETGVQTRTRVICQNGGKWLSKLSKSVRVRPTDKYSALGLGGRAAVLSRPAMRRGCEVAPISSVEWAGKWMSLRLRIV